MSYPLMLTELLYAYGSECKTNISMVNVDTRCLLRWTSGPSRLALSKGRRPSGGFCIHQMNRVNSRNGYFRDDSTIDLPT